MGHTRGRIIFSLQGFYEFMKQTSKQKTMNQTKPTTKLKSNYTRLLKLFKKLLSAICFISKPGHQGLVESLGRWYSLLLSCMADWGCPIWLQRPAWRNYYHMASHWDILLLGLTWKKKKKRSRKRQRLLGSSSVPLSPSVVNIPDKETPWGNLMKTWRNQWVTEVWRSALEARASKNLS